MSSRIILNGGFEQGILEAVKETQGLNEKDQARLDYLQSLPQDRVEHEGKIIATCDIKSTDIQIA